MFVTWTARPHEFTDFIGAAIRILVSGIPDKIKFVMGSSIPISVPESSESLVVIARDEWLIPESLMLDILNKRWQTLDLISMVEELKRSVSKEFNRLGYRKQWLSQFNLQMVSVKDRLSSRPRFKREEDLIDSA